MDGVDIVIVKKIRDKFAEHLTEEDNSNLSRYDQRDVDRIKTSDTFVWRFVEDRKGDVETVVSSTVKSLITCLAWRKERNVNDLEASDFPREVIGSGRVRVGA